MHLMIDLETLSIKLDCVVISLGAVTFDETGIKKTFYACLDVVEQIDKKRAISGDTLKWWMGQTDAAKIVFDDEYLPVNNVLLNFLEFVCFEAAPADKLQVWSNGSNFDIAIMENLFAQYNEKPPWSFRNIRDYRTFKKYNCQGVDIKFKGTAHNPLDDSIHQAQVVIAGLKKCQMI